MCTHTSTQHIELVYARMHLCMHCYAHMHTYYASIIRSTYNAIPQKVCGLLFTLFCHSTCNFKEAL